jgi:GNAT superfamily N-acetyltransferase
MTTGPDSTPSPPPQSLAIVPATPHDAAAIRALTRAAYAKWVAILGREPKPMLADYDAAVRRHRIDLLRRGGQLAALIELVPETDHLLIKNIAVLPEHQGTGLGTRLLAHAEEVAAALGHAELRLYASKRFAENIRLYRRVGYAIDREEEFMGGITVYMSKRI